MPPKESAAATAALPLLLTRDGILKADDLPHEDVSVPEWGGVVRVRALAASERDAYEDSCIREGKDGKSERNMENVRAKLCARTIIGADGSRLFSDADIAQLGRKSAAALDRVFAVAARLSRIRKQDVEELVGNSDAARGAGPS